MTNRNKNDDEATWVPPLVVPLRRIRPHFWTFSACFVATLVFYIFVHVIAAENPDWRQAPSAIMGDTARAGGFWIFASPVLLEGALMVFAAMFRQETREKGRREGLEEGRAEANNVWEEWNRRRVQAEANGEPFTEPPPSARNGSSGE